MSAFVPITAVPHGDILEAKLSGISMIRLDYSARLHETFSLTVASSYFILSDLGTYRGPPVERDGHILGNEFSARIMWAPVSDVRLGLGGGVFLPAMGNADSSGAALWRLGLNVIILIF